MAVPVLNTIQVIGYMDAIKRNLSDFYIAYRHFSSVVLQTDAGTRQSLNNRISVDDQEKQPATSNKGTGLPGGIMPKANTF